MLFSLLYSGFAWPGPCCSPPLPAPPPPAFLVLGQRPGSSPAESHHTAVYRRAPARRARTAPRACSTRKRKQNGTRRRCAPTTPHHTAPHRTAHQTAAHRTTTHTTTRARRPDHTTPHRTAPHRTAPHCTRQTATTAPHRTAPHRTSTARARPCKHARRSRRMHTHDAGRVGGWAWRWVIARSPRRKEQTAPTTPRTAAARHTLPSHTDTPTTPTHTRTPQPPHAHARRSAGRWAWKWVVYGRSGRAGRRSLKKSAPSLAFSTAVPTRERRSAGKTGAGETHNGERIGRACALGGQAGGTAACAARRVRARRGRAAGFAWCGDRQPQTTGDGAQRATGRSGRRGASVDGRLMRLPRARTGALAYNQERRWRGGGGGQLAGRRRRAATGHAG